MSHDELCPVKDKPCHGLDNGDCPDEYGHFPSCPQAYCCCSLISAVVARERTLTADRMLPVLARLMAKAQISKNDARDVAAAVRGGEQ